MDRAITVRRLWLLAVAGVLAVSLAAPAYAQTGTMKGSVKDEKGQPVEGAQVTIELESAGRKLETKTDKRGEFIQLGLMPGVYKVYAQKDNLGDAQQVQVRLASPANVNLVMKGMGGASKEQVALRQALEAGNAAIKAANYDEAIVQFKKATEAQANCPDCYYAMGYAYQQKKDFPNAEASFKKTIELKADYADAYDGLAKVYAAEGKTEEAKTASNKAAELAAAGGTIGASADTLYRQGVILWNGGKIPEAKKQFEAAVAADPNHAESHYQLGMALLNEGKMPEASAEFEKYLALAPNGPNAATAKGLLAQLKK